MIGQGQVLGDDRKQASFQDFDGGAKQGDWLVGFGVIVQFAGFEQRYDFSGFVDVGYSACSERLIEEAGQVGNSVWSEVSEVKDGEFVWSSGFRWTGMFYCVGHLCR